MRRLMVTTAKVVFRALNAETLQSLWISEKVSGQMISPITYHNGYIYTGTWNSETETGTYFALPVTIKIRRTKHKMFSGVSHIRAGFYWAGAYATDKYVAFGSDDVWRNEQKKRKRCALPRSIR